MCPLADRERSGPRRTGDRLSVQPVAETLMWGKPNAAFSFGQELASSEEKPVLSGTAPAASLPGAYGGEGISLQGARVSRQSATSAYFTLMGCLATAVVLSMIASSVGLALALVENSLSTDCRWKLFMAQKGISRALCSLSGTP